MMQEVYMCDILPHIINGRVTKTNKYISIWNNNFNGKIYTHFKIGCTKIATYCHDEQSIKVLTGDWSHIQGNPYNYDGLGSFARKGQRQTILLK